MRVRVLGSAAGGGFPQWNCSCPGCTAARDGSATPRTQSSLAIGTDDGRWFLVNASPDVRQQMTACPALHPAAGRATPLDAVLLTDAEIDHTLGLLLLREGRGVTIHATAATEATLRHGTGFLTTLERYCPVEVVPVEPGVEVALTEDLSYTAVDLPTGKAPRFAEVGSADDPGRVVGYRFRDARTGGVVVHAPGVAGFVPALLDACEGASCLLVDGTCWDDDELISLGLGTKTAGDMGHLALAGPGGSLERLARLPVPRRVLVHINNSNPILREGTPQRAALAEAGVEVGSDGLEILA